MLKKILLGFSVIILLFLGYVAVKPADFMFAREVFISAKPEVIFPHINNSQKANQWMPWKDSDPTAQMVYSGPAEGVGSTTTWDSPGKMGTGKAEVVESIPNQTVKTKLTYTKPMEMSQMAEVSLTPSNGGTTVRWSVSGHNNFIGRLFCTLMSMDKMVGPEFEKGLNNLKKTAESGTN